ncbi:hypothetical protein OG897_26180 [Streptomyces sp. NBC_00237]|uniref:hypothetical protein n=1 Tax=Streptomyces sp. NBC_00237 TaxID=2975687 RepID=UPI00224F791F|nr:hypothetical protein [Streptomyces sp. NBC_00237]MCX5204930.1 hypothetical protein [Streptomyces sp. NBC_00237]
MRDAAPASSPAPVDVSPGKPLHAFLAVVLWVATAASLACLLLFVGTMSLWMAAADVNPLGYVATTLAVLAVGAVCLSAVRKLPRLRPLPYVTRAAALGAVACPFPAAAAWLLFATG